MGCHYILRGHRFDSELELDDFLITKWKFHSTQGDAVFNESEKFLAGKSYVERIKNDAKKYDLKNKKRRVYGEEETSYDFDKKSKIIGVNKFTNQYRTDEGRRLHPEFEEDEYWNERIAAWKKGEFTEDEKEVFEVDGTPITDKTLHEKFKQQMMAKWETQCLMGDAIHAVFQVYFTKDSKTNVYNHTLLKTDKDHKQKLIERLSKFKWKKRDGSFASFNDIVDDKTLENIFKECEKFKAELDKKFGVNCEYYPELDVVGDLDRPFADCTKIHGVIDLLVLDEQGYPHVLDYKTSLKTYENFDSAKKLAFTYQLGIYGRILQKAGFRFDMEPYNIVPIQIQGFTKIGEDQYKFSNIGLAPSVFKSLESEINSNTNIVNNLEDIMHIPIKTNIAPEKILQNTDEQMRILAPSGYELTKEYTREDMIKELTDDNALEGPSEDYNGKWIWKKNYNKDPIILADSKEDLIEKALGYRKKLPQLRKYVVDTVVNGLKEGQKNNTAEVNWPKQTESKAVGINNDWFKVHMKKYCSSNWEVIDEPEYEPLKRYGIILLLNKATKQLDIVKVTGKAIKRAYNFGKNRNNLLGAHNIDMKYLSRKKDLMLAANNGNFEAMEAMIVLNQLPALFEDNNVIIGNINIMDPKTGYGITVSNKELMYCFNEFAQIKEIKEFTDFKNNIGTTIKMASKAHLARTELSDVLSEAKSNEYKDIYAKFENFDASDGCKSQLDSCIEGNIDDKLKALNKIKSDLEKAYGRSLEKVSQDQDTLNEPHIKIYNQVMLAIAELNGIDFRQQLNDHDKWCESWAIASKGYHATYMDNPGNLQSETLNLLTNMTTEAYQNVRSDMQEPTAKLRQLTEKLKIAKGFNGLKERTIGNHADLYKNMYREEALKNGDLVFKNPWTDPTLQPEEAEYLKYVLQQINKNRFGSKSDEYIENLRKEDKYDYFKVPLCKGDNSSYVSQKGLFNALKNRLKGWLPSEVVKRMRDEVGNIDKFEENVEERKRARERENLFEMTNRFDRGEEPYQARLEYIARQTGGTAYFETNVETLALRHMFAYSMKKRIDAVMPNIKAAMIHLTLQGAIQNTVFKNDLKYAEDYIRNKIKNETIVDPKYEKHEAYAQKLKKVASALALGFSPKQFLYQTIQGIWNDISLIIRKPDGTNAFSLKNMVRAARIVYKELFNVGDKPSVMKLLNELYGVNDMDMNTYIERLKSDHFGFFNFTNMAFKFASRPDFYNRMTIFSAKMLEDGSLKAHSVNEKGELVYNWKEDERFSAFANNDTSDIEKYNKQRALYYAMAKQFEKEHTKIKIGDSWVDFKLDMSNPMPLPRAYTNLEAESMKSLSDTIYGYYSHEKKSMVQSTLLGGMWMQFRTYWSGKKNQYFSGGAVRLEGHWEQYKENGQEYYYQIDEHNNIRYDLPPITKAEAEKKHNGLAAPVMVWKGDWREGILKTICDLVKNCKEYGWSEGWRMSLYDENGELKNIVRSNIIQMFYDAMIILTVGNLLAGSLTDWYDEEKKDADEKDFAEQLKLSTLNLLIGSLKNSTMDFYLIDSILKPLEDWSPFSLTYYMTVLTRTFNAVTSDDPLGKSWDNVVKLTSVGKQFEPVIDVIKPDFPTFGEDE